MLELSMLDLKMGLKVSFLIEPHSTSFFFAYKWLVVRMFAKVSEAFAQSWQDMRAPLEGADEHGDLQPLAVPLYLINGVVLA
mgnify:CR=1 FL=1